MKYRRFHDGQQLARPAGGRKPGIVVEPIKNFQLACAYSGQILAYQKMLGQLVDAGNTVTLVHYLHLLEGDRKGRDGRPPA